jgi:tetratricopeptide (TPR) repeat protein
MSDGSYLTWAAPRLPVYIDGRLEVYGEQAVADYLNLLRQRDWNRYFDRLGVNVILVHRDHLSPYLRRLRASNEWVLVHIDHRDYIFVRDIPAHAALIRARRIDGDRPWTPPDDQLDPTPTGWRAAIGAVESPVRTLGLADALLRLGDLIAAKNVLERAAPRFQADADVRALLGLICRAQGQDDQADEWLDPAYVPVHRRATVDAQTPAFVRAGLGQAMRVGNLDEAERFARRWMRLAPESPQACATLGRLLIQAGRHAEAADCLERAVQLDPGNAAYAAAAVQARARAADD